MYSNLHQLARTVPLVLGSSSPRRKRLLGEMDIPFDVEIPSIDETQLPGEPAYGLALRLAREKALEVCERLGRDTVTLGCDTIVVLDGTILPKPDSKTRACEILRDLSGNQHTVCSALAIASKGIVITDGYETTAVYFNPVTDEQIREYVESEEPMDKAGAYGIQGMGAFLVDRIEGNLDTVIGLPRTLLERLAGDILSKM